MKLTVFFKRFLLIFGDLCLLYLAFCVSIYLRFHFRFDALTYQKGLLPFGLLFLCWLFVFVMNHFYEFEFSWPFRRFMKYFLRAFFLNALLAASWFYFLSFTDFAPKTILFICWGLAFILLLLWHYLFSFLTVRMKPKRVAFIENPWAWEIKEYISGHPALGYEAVIYKDINEFKNKFASDSIDLFVFSPQSENEDLIITLAGKNLSFLPLSQFYEEIFGRVNLELIDKEWFVYHFSLEDRLYLLLKRTFDFIFAFSFLLLTSPVAAFIALAIKLTSPGPVFYRSLRVGQNLKTFQVYKFRTMVPEADKLGPAWALDNDKRITAIGRWLRKFHLDEWPQLINVLKGELSLIGPRPVEVKLAEEFNQKIKFYRLRHLVRPGVVGWAQLNYRYSASLEDEIKKLEYDLYYLKYRGFVLDFIIFIKSWRIPLDVKAH